jgi:hypothetical protein
MSITTWKKDFYPVSARNANISHIKALDHSILKWSGLHDKILKQYGLYAKYDELFDLETNKVVFNIDGSTCALCLYDNTVENDEPCSICPITVYAKKTCGVEYRFFKMTNSPKAMLTLLKKTRRLFLKENKK